MYLFICKNFALLSLFLISPYSVRQTATFIIFAEKTIKTCFNGAERN